MRLSPKIKLSPDDRAAFQVCPHTGAHFDFPRSFYRHCKFPIFVYNFLVRDDPDLEQAMPRPGTKDDLQLPGLYFLQPVKSAMNMYWPLCVVVLANVLYNIASKSIPAGASPWAVLVVTYLVSSFLSLIAFFLFENDRNFLYSLQKLDWTGFALGLSMVGLEIGYIFIYRTGWKLSVASLLANILLAVILLLIGVFIYKERLDIRQFTGIALCIAGCALLLSQK